MRNVIQKDQNSFFFKKIPKNRPATGGFIPRSPSVIRLSKLVYLHKSPNLDIFICNFCFKPSPFRKLSVVPNQDTASDLSFYDMFVPHEVPLSKISDDFIACDFWFAPPPQSNILATSMHGGWHFQPCPPKSLLVLPKRE